jgi:hypothetical protein
MEENIMKALYLITRLLVIVIALAACSQDGDSGGGVALETADDQPSGTSATPTARRRRDAAPGRGRTGVARR